MAIGLTCGSLAQTRNSRIFLKKLEGLLHFHFPEISAEICLPWSESSSCFRGNKRRMDLLGLWEDVQASLMLNYNGCEVG